MLIYSPHDILRERQAWIISCALEMRNRGSERASASLMVIQYLSDRIGVDPRLPLPKRNDTDFTEFIYLWV
jgi:hypothetical protein